jgi:hypothetical protein
MDRFLELVEMALLNETTMVWIDTLLLCLGLTLTIASAAPALQALRQARTKPTRGAASAPVR